LNENESLFIESLSASDREKYFFEIWTQKEAVTKLEGHGLSRRFENIHLQDGRVVRFEEGQSLTDEIGYSSFNTSDFFLSLAYSPIIESKIIFKGCPL
jgi:phosphopantetheinyl transferase